MIAYPKPKGATHKHAQTGMFYRYINDVLETFSYAEDAWVRSGVTNRDLIVPLNATKDVEAHSIEDVLKQIFPGCEILKVGEDDVARALSSKDIPEPVFTPAVKEPTRDELIDEMYESLQFNHAVQAVAKSYDAETNIMVAMMIKRAIDSSFVQPEHRTKVKARTFLNNYKHGISAEELVAKLMEQGKL